MVIDLSAILVPVDFSSDSQFIVEYAIAMAATFHAAVTLMHVCERADSMSGIVPGLDAAADDKKDLALAKKALVGLRTANPTHTETAVRVRVVQGSPTRNHLDSSSVSDDHHGHARPDGTRACLDGKRCRSRRPQVTLPRLDDSLPLRPPRHGVTASSGLAPGPGVSPRCDGSWPACVAGPRFDERRRPRPSKPDAQC